MKPLEIDKLPCVTREELERDFDSILARVENGESPILIRSEGQPDLLLIGWEDYWRRFGVLYPDGERERIEAMCRDNAEKE